MAFCAVVSVLAAQTGDKREMAARLLQEAARLREEGTTAAFRKGIGKAREAAALLHEAGDAGQEADAWALAGRLERRAGDFAAARQSFNRSLELAHAIPDRLREATAGFLLGLISYEFSELDKALRYYEEALAVFRALGKDSFEGQTLNNIGLVYSNQGRLGDALAAYTRALELARLVKNRGGEVDALRNIATVHHHRGDLTAALEGYHLVLAMYRESKDYRGETETLTNIAAVYADLGEFETGRKFIEQALAIQRRTGNRRGEAVTLANLAEDLIASGSAAKGLEYHVQALAVFQELGDVRNQAEQFGSLGHAYERLGQAAKAREYYTRSMTTHHELGLAEDEGFAHLRLGLWRGPGSGLADEKETARRHLEEAVRLLRSAGSRRFEARALFGLAQWYEEAGQPQQALGYVEAALHLDEEVRHSTPANELRASFLAFVRNHYEFQAELLMQLGREREAFEAAERARARSLLDVVSGARQPEPLSLAQVQQGILDPGNVLLQYLLGKKRSFLWIVTRDGFRTIAIEKRETLEAASRKAHAALSGGGSLDALRSMAKAILPEIHALPNGTRLLIAADGALHYVPFAALPGLTAGHEVVMVPSISAVAAMRARALDQPRPPQSLLVFADPVFSAEDPRVAVAGPRRPEKTQVPTEIERSAKDAGLTNLYRLRSTRQEAEAIAALMPGGTVRKALDFEATRGLALHAEMSRYRLIHFATHGLLNSVHPERSGIVLSLVDRSGKPQNGFLRVSDIYDLKLQAELVVLSACQTALGKEVHGEGLLGVTRGFLFAGVPRVVSSLWRVPDGATAELMKRFYQGMFQHGLPPAAALRRAQESMRGEPRWAAPLNWAGFALYGEWR